MEDRIPVRLRPYEVTTVGEGHVVIETATNEIQHTFSDPLRASDYRDALNRWHDSRPSPDSVPLGFHVEPNAAALVALVDSIYDPEERLVLLAASLRVS